MAQRIFSIPSCSETENEEKGLSISSFDSFPNDVVTNILLMLPAQCLYSSARYVCKTWAEISQQPYFIKSHLLHSECDLLIQDSHSPYKVQSINASDLALKDTDLNFKFPGKLRGSSDGVLLINKSSSVMDLYVANPVMMQVFKLPTLPSTCMLSSHCNNIGRTSSTGEIKVVSIGREPKNGVYDWYVITVGKVMSWRKISSCVLKECDAASYLSYVQSLSVDGVVYWTNYSSWITNQSVLAIDLGSETLHHLKVPSECHGQYWRLVQMGREICCMKCGKDVDMKVWKLKSLHRSEWVMVNRIRFSKETLLGKNFCMPLIWLDSEVLVISVYVQVSNVVVAYRVNEGEYRVIKMDDIASHAIFTHTSSLIKF